MRRLVMGDNDAGWRGMHSENQLWTTLFGLLMWDCIYDVNDEALRDVWRHEYQGLPLDFGGPAFYDNRRPSIDARLHEIAGFDAGELANAVRTVWSTHRGTYCPCILWHLFDVDDLCDLVVAAGSKAMSAILRLLSQNYDYWRAGFPDLCLWRDPGGKGGARNFFLIEVKGPGDSLSSTQTEWLYRLSKMPREVQVGVCRVRRL